MGQHEQRPAQNRQQRRHVVRGGGVRVRLLQQREHVCKHARRSAARRAGGKQRRSRWRVRRRRAQLGQRVAMRRAPPSCQLGGGLSGCHGGGVLRLGHLNLQSLKLSLDGAPHSLKLSRWQPVSTGQHVKAGKASARCVPQF